MQIQRLNQLAPTDAPLPFPHSSQIVGELRELRCHFGRRLFRILYRRSHNLFVLLHIFEKASREIPKPDIEIVIARWDDFQQRMDAPHSKPPRAAGPDAP
jgi:phage-related protein